MKEVSDQARVALAFALALLVMVGWYFLNPPKPQPPPGSPASQTQRAADLPAGAGGAVAQPGQAVSANSTGATSLKGAVSAAPVTATGEKEIVVESDLYRVELSNRGGVVRSWQLKKYTDEGNPPRVLDLVNADLARQTDSWPLSLQLPDAQLESAANQGLYVVKASSPSGAASTDNTIAAPAQIEFHWSDGQLDVTKTLKFDRNYIIGVETAVQQNGRPASYSIAWRGGFGDVTAFRAAVQTLVFDDRDGSISTINSKNVGVPNQRNIPAAVPGTFDAAGIEDLYFAAAFLPAQGPTGQPSPEMLTLSTRQTTHTLQADGKTQQEILPEMAVGSTAPGPLNVRLYVGPKDIDTLKAVRPPLNGLVQFGWFGFIAEPLFYILRWIYHYIPNYGWAIVVMTVAINMLLYPLKVKSWRSMQKMQKVGPEIRQIQDRYKKYSMRDPRKQEMNKEVMAVYSREGVNPMGSCLPQVIQMPIWFGLYRMLNVTLELRHAPWFGWFHDLAGRDPYFILTIAMAILMYATQKMTPMTVTDPSQQRMMTLMPLMFVGMFFLIPVSTGLILYIVTQNIVAVLQQLHLNRSSPLKAPSRVKKQVTRAALSK